ncbi:MAG: hypothetical protein FJ207_12150 [Gemmatimonadetes bacterium]|nr:hypothetical protein [Gemmatimonadota bacterium]
MTFQLDGPILGFIAAATVVAALVAGGIPALKASGAEVNSVLKDESRGSSSLRIGRLSRILVIGQIAMSLGLLVSAGLMTKSISRLKNYDYQFETDAVFTARVGLFAADFPDTLSRRAFYRDVELRLREIPEARAAALGTVLPGLGSGGGYVAVEGETYADDRSFPTARSGVVGPGYFAAVGVQVLRGRDLEIQDDDAGTPVSIVNQSFAERHFPGGSALGGRFRARATRAARSRGARSWAWCRTSTCAA